MAASANDRPADERAMTVSKRSLGELTAALQSWLTERLGEQAKPTVSGARLPSSNGLSSTSLLFEADWTEIDGTEVDGTEVAQTKADPAEADPAEADQSGPGAQANRHGSYVARLAPEVSALPCGARVRATSAQTAPGPSRTPPSSSMSIVSSASTAMTMPPLFRDRPDRPCPPLKMPRGTSRCFAA